jgi:predicted DNA-binding WGR domain protein
VICSALQVIIIATGCKATTVTYYAPSKTGGKFWRISRTRETTTTTFGQTGSQGRTIRKRWNSVSAAERYRLRMIVSKQRKGYIRA